MPVCHLSCLSAMHILCHSRDSKVVRWHGPGCPVQPKVPLWVDQWLVGRVAKRHSYYKHENTKTIARKNKNQYKTYTRVTMGFLFVLLEVLCTILLCHLSKCRQRQHIDIPCHNIDILLCERTQIQQNRYKPISTPPCRQL